MADSCAIITPSIVCSFAKRLFYCNNFCNLMLTLHDTKNSYLVYCTVIVTIVGTVHFLLYLILVTYPMLYACSVVVHVLQ